MWWAVERQIVLDGGCVELKIGANDSAGKTSRGLTREGIVSEEMKRKHKMPALSTLVLITAKGYEPRGCVDTTIPDSS